MGKGGQFDPPITKSPVFITKGPFKIYFTQNKISCNFCLSCFRKITFWSSFGLFSSYFRHLNGYSTGITEMSKIVPKMAQNIFFENIMKIKVVRNCILSGIDFCNFRCRKSILLGRKGPPFLEELSPIRSLVGIILSIFRLRHCNRFRTEKFYNGVLLILELPNYFLLKGSK